MSGRIGRALASAAILFATPAASKEVELKFTQTLDIRETEVPYELQVRLTENAPARLGVDALVDLIAAQKALSGAMAGYVIVDTCFASVRVDRLEVLAEKDAFAFSGAMTAEIYRCEFEGLQPTHRGERLLSQAIAVGLVASVEVQGNCAVFHLEDIEVEQDGSLKLDDEQKELIARTGDLLRVASEELMAKNPICPKLPAELESLDPQYDAGGTREIGNGGAGVYLRGSIDVSTGTILSILSVLQQEGVIPDAP